MQWTNGILSSASSFSWITYWITVTTEQYSCLLKNKEQNTPQTYSSSWIDCTQQISKQCHHNERASPETCPCLVMIIMATQVCSAWWWITIDYSPFWAGRQKPSLHIHLWLQRHWGQGMQRPWKTWRRDKWLLDILLVFPRSCRLWTEVCDISHLSAWLQLWGAFPIKKSLKLQRKAEECLRKAHCETYYSAPRPLIALILTGLLHCWRNWNDEGRS